MFYIVVRSHRVSNHKQYGRGPCFCFHENMQFNKNRKNIAAIADDSFNKKEECSVPLLQYYERVILVFYLRVSNTKHNIQSDTVPICDEGYQST